MQLSGIWIIRSQYTVRDGDLMKYRNGTHIWRKSFSYKRMHSGCEVPFFYDIDRKVNLSRAMNMIGGYFEWVKRMGYE